MAPQESTDPTPLPLSARPPAHDTAVAVVVPLARSPMGPPPLPPPSSRSQSSNPLAKAPQSPHVAARSSGGPMLSHSGLSEEHGEMSDPRTLSSSTNLTKFSFSTKNFLEQLYGGNCWHCGRPMLVETAHILGASKNRYFAQLQGQGLANIKKLSDKDNGIRLCALCHKTFDAKEPSWVFIPANLDYFTQFEMKDYHRRVDHLNSPGSFPKRVCPSPLDYQNHSDSGGMYDSYMRENFLHEATAYEADFSPGRSKVLPHPKEWLGDPMMTLQRGFKMVGWAPNVFPDPVQVSLFNLSRLYHKNNEAPPRDQQETPNRASHDHKDSDESNQDQPPPEHDLPGTTFSGKNYASKTAKQNPPSTSKPNVTTRHVSQQHQHGQDEARALLENPPNKRLRREILEGIWKWGHFSSSNDAAMVYARSKCRREGDDGGTMNRGIARRLVQGLPSPTMSRRS